MRARPQPHLVRHIARQITHEDVQIGIGAGDGNCPTLQRAGSQAGRQRRVRQAGWGTASSSGSCGSRACIRGCIGGCPTALALDRGWAGAGGRPWLTWFSGVLVLTALPTATELLNHSVLQSSRW